MEDHPKSYAKFEGVIPKGQYGGGTVMVWDQGIYHPLTKTPLKDLKNGKLHFVLQGEKLQGEWYLVRFRTEEHQWLIIKTEKSMKPVSKRADDRSVLTGHTMNQIIRADQNKARTKPRPRKKTSVPQKSLSAPLPSFVEPMKAKLVAVPPRGKWLYEIKFDGWRALALKGTHQISLLSRNKKDLGSKFPEILKSISELKVDDVILDGEIVALDKKGRPSFQLLQAYDSKEKRPPLFFYVFDILRMNGRDLKHIPLETRKQLLESLLKKPPGVLRYSASLANQPQELMKQARRMGLEGLIGKRQGSIYEVGRRSGSWIKLKFLCEQEFVIGGYTDPQGSRPFFGAIIVGYYQGKDLLFAAKVGTGFSSPMLRTLHKQFQGLLRKSCPFANLPLPGGGKWGQTITQSEMKRCHWLRPALVCEVRFHEWTRDGHLRQPVFLGLRTDKDASEVVRE